MTKVTYKRKFIVGHSFRGESMAISVVSMGAKRQAGKHGDLAVGGAYILTHKYKAEKEQTVPGVGF